MIGKTSSLTAALLLFGSLGFAFVTTLPIDLGNTQEPFWAGLREAQAKRVPNWGEAFATRLNIFTEREALDILAQRYLSVAGSRAINGVGWSSLELIPEPHTEALIIGLSRVPILSEPKLLSNHLKVYAVAHDGEVFPIVGEEQVPVKGLSPGVGPMDAGEWVKVLTKIGARGWVRREGSTRTAILRVPQIPARPVDIDSSPVQASRTTSGSLIVVVGFLFMLLALWGLIKSRTRPRLVHSGVWRDSSEPPNSDSYEFLAFDEASVEEEGLSETTPQPEETTPLPMQRPFERSGRNYEREDFFGDLYIGHEDGGRTYRRADFFGDQYHEVAEGGRAYERTDFFGDRYIENTDGTRSYYREDFFGDEYIENPDGSRTYKRKDFFGDTYWKRDD